MTERNHTIGEISRLSGISVRRLRFYADNGLLPPTGRTDSGYRIFSEGDLVRIGLIRALRDAGISLDGIRQILARRQSMHQILEVRLAEIEAQIKSQGRLASAIRAALRSPEPNHDDLRRIWIMSNLSNVERKASVKRFFDQVTEDIEVEAKWKSRMLRLVSIELPDDPTSEQLDAWIELSGLMADSTFIAQMRANAEDSYAGMKDAAAFQEMQQSIVPKAQDAIARGLAPESEVGLNIAKEYMEGWARAHKVAPDADFYARMRRKHFEHADNTRRFWDLVGVLGGLKDRSAPVPEWLWIGAASKNYVGRKSRLT